MQAHASDDGVFIRSMATRGHLGGLARATLEASLVLDAAGKDVVIVETVGVGQGEIDIVRTADVSIVVLVPGAGDEVQTLKAGIMEIADIFVVNKADREGADRTVASIEALLNLDDWSPPRWRHPVLKTEATRGTGVEELLEAIERFRGHAAAAPAARLRERTAWRLREMLADRFLAHVEGSVLQPGEMECSSSGLLRARSIPTPLSPRLQAGRSVPVPLARLPRHGLARRPRSRRHPGAMATRTAIAGKRKQPFQDPAA